MRRWQMLTVLLLFVAYTGCYLVPVELFGHAAADQAVAGRAGLLEPKRAQIAPGHDRLAGRAGLRDRKVRHRQPGRLPRRATQHPGRHARLGAVHGCCLPSAARCRCSRWPGSAIGWCSRSCWTGMVKITGKWFSFSSYGTAMGVVSLSYLFGDAAARRFMGWLLEAGLGWREVFWRGRRRACLRCSCVDWLWLKESPVAIGHSRAAGQPAERLWRRRRRRQPAEPARAAGAAGDEPACSWSCVCLSLGLTLLRETFNTWSADLLCRRAGLHRAPRPPITARCFRCWAASSVLVAGWLGDRLGQGGRGA